MTTKLQRNPSTLKLLRNSATGKLMVTKDYMTAVCGWCNGTQPKAITIAFSGFIDQECCTPDWPGNYSYYSTGASAALNKAHTVPHLTGCQYFATIPASVLLQRYDEAACGGDMFFDVTVPSLRINVTFQEAGVWIFVDSLYYEIKCFEGTILYSEGESCGNTNNTASNINTPCPDTQADVVVLASSGIASITLPDPD